MTIRQQILKWVYPVWLGFTRLVGKNAKIMGNNEHKKPVTSIYDFQVELNNGQILDLSSLKGKKLLLVNTASDCGYTPQYADLQTLYDTSKDNLVVIGFPANDFGEQEKGSNEEIASFCQLNFGVSFPLAKKSTVVKGVEQNPVFQWLSDSQKNGWNNQGPVWNFSKYLIDEEGNLVHYFEPSVSPTGPEIGNAIKKG